MRSNEKELNLDEKTGKFYTMNPCLEPGIWEDFKLVCKCLGAKEKQEVPLQLPNRWDLIGFQISLKCSRVGFSATTCESSIL